MVLEYANKQIAYQISCFGQLAVMKVNMVEGLVFRYRRSVY